jgi:hypothetical protein
MESENRYIKASRYDFKVQSHNSRVFHRELVARPWRSLACAIGMSILGMNAIFNFIDAPGWNRHPWMGWLLGVVALLFVCYFLICAVLGWQAPPASSHETQS